MLTRVLVVNVNWGTRPKRADHLIDGLVRRFNPDVILACETKRIRLAQVLGVLFAVLQGRGNGQNNAAVAWRKDHGKAKRRRFILGTMPNGARMLPRWITRVVLRIGCTRIVFQVLHLPPSRYSRLYAPMVRVVTRHMRPKHLVMGGDRNQANLAAATKGMSVRHAGVMFVASTLPIRHFESHRVDGFDHPVLLAVVES